MSTIAITGGTPLGGAVRVSGSKNGSLPLLAASLLIDGEVIFKNIPEIADVTTMIEMLKALGAQVTHDTGDGLRIDASNINSVSAPYDLVRRMRGSFYVAGPLLARFGEAQVPLPGGCVIGTRPVDFHIRGFKALGATVEEKYGVMHAEAKKLHGARIYMDPRLRSVGATVNIMLSGALAEGVTVIENASREPEVVDCQRFLTACGADIRGIGTTTLEIHGVSKLHGCEWTAISDRMEAGTFLIAGAMTGGDITLDPVDPEHMQMVFDMLQQVGCEITAEGSTGALMAGARGTSVIEETIFDARFNYVDELIRMGADVRVMEGAAIFKGVPQLYAAPVVATDIRAGAALILAGLVAEGTTEISGAELVGRGYVDIIGKLSELGADIESIAQTDQEDM